MPALPGTGAGDRQRAVGDLSGSSSLAPLPSSSNNINDLAPLAVYGQAKQTTVHIEGAQVTRIMPSITRCSSL
jgi:hypothetical protein